MDVAAKDIIQLTEENYKLKEIIKKMAEHFEIQNHELKKTQQLRTIALDMVSTISITCFQLYMSAADASTLIFDFFAYAVNKRANTK